MKPLTGITVVLLLLAAGCLPFAPLRAQAPASYSSADIYLQLKKLNVLGSVLYIAAHPDDENTRLLAYLAREKQYRTGYLSLTRGDGGQNLIGDEQGIELGLIRTQELLAARRIDGAEQFFSRAYDFGFCKTAKEAIATWGHDKILSDVVWVIRKFQPDVIITRFPGDERAGHGHHQASQILAQEAFFAAADPKMFPEQFAHGVQPWQAKRILWNTFNFGTTNTTGENQFKIDVGVYNPLLGKSYGEIASESRSQHKSQGFGVPRQRGQQFEFFLHTAGDSLTGSLMDGIQANWGRVAGAEKVESAVQAITMTYDFQHPEKSLPALVQLYNTIKGLPQGYWRDQKLAEVQQLVLACSGLFAESTSSQPYAVQGSALAAQLFVSKRAETKVRLKQASLLGFDTTLNIDLGLNKNVSFTKTFPIAVNTPVSQPYWLANPLAGGSYQVDDQVLIGKAENDPVFTATFVFTIEGVDFTVQLPVQYKYTDPVKGELYQPLRVVPAITGTFDQPVYVMDGAKEKQVQLQLKAKKRLPLVRVNIAASTNWKVAGGAWSDSIRKDGVVDIDATISPVNGTTGQLGVTVSSITDDQQQAYSAALLTERRIEYDHIPELLYYQPLQATAEKINVVVKGRKIGYITGAGDKVPQALQQLGYEVELLNEKNVTESNLRKFDAVITGIRAYNVHDWLTGKYDILMGYVNRGGNLIVQYNTNNFISTVSSRIGPYPFGISRTRVTDETVAVQFALPEHPVLNIPNKITQDDFAGWVQERTVYQAEKQDSRFAAPLSFSDANEPASNGSLIIAPYGKGNFVYTGLVFFRQLPAGVPGAYRLMANLIALPKNITNE